MLQEFLQLNVFAFMMVFARIGTAFLILPGFSSLQISMRARLSLALAVSFLIMPLVIAQMPPVPGAPMMVFALLAGEVVAGAILGTIPLILLASVHVAGPILSFISGMANALTFDPVVQSQSALVSGFLSTVGILLIFVTDLHHLFIQAMVDSYTLFQPGVAPDIGDAAQMIARHVAQTFLVGTQMSIPFIVLSFAYNVGLGIMTRISPQIPIFFVAMPLQLVLSIIVMMIVVPGIMLALLTHMTDGMQGFLIP